jgi:putative spermidine/putrescine transport system permease protein
MKPTSTASSPALGLLPKLIAAAGLILLILPQLMVVVTSIDPQATSIFPPKSVSLRWYVNALERQAFREAFLISVLIASAVALTTTLIGTLAAIATVRYRYWGRDLVVALLQLPVMIPEVILGLGFLILFSRSGFRLSLLNIYLTHVVIALPYAVRVIAANLQTVSVSLEEAAYVLGAGPVKSFVLVTLPIIQRGLLAAAIFAFVVSFDNFMLAAFLATGRGTLPLEVYSYIRTESDPTVAAISTMLILLSIASVLLLERVLGLETLSQVGKVGR